MSNGQLLGRVVSEKKDPELGIWKADIFLSSMGF